MFKNKTLSCICGLLMIVTVVNKFATILLLGCLGAWLWLQKEK